MGRCSITASAPSLTTTSAALHGSLLSCCLAGHSCLMSEAGRSDVSDGGILYIPAPSPPVSGRWGVVSPAPVAPSRGGAALLGSVWSVGPFRDSTSVGFGGGGASGRRTTDASRRGCSGPESSGSGGSGYAGGSTPPSSVPLDPSATFCYFRCSSCWIPRHLRKRRHLFYHGCTLPRRSFSLVDGFRDISFLFLLLLLRWELDVVATFSSSGSSLSVCLPGRIWSLPLVGRSFVCFLGLVYHSTGVLLLFTAVMPQGDRWRFFRYCRRSFVLCALVSGRLPCASTHAISLLLSPRLGR